MPIDGIRKLSDRIGAAFKASVNTRMYGGVDGAATINTSWTAPAAGVVTITAIGIGGPGGGASPADSSYGRSGAAGIFSNVEVATGDVIQISLAGTSVSRTARGANTTVTLPDGRVGIAQAGFVDNVAATATGFDKNFPGSIVSGFVPRAGSTCPLVGVEDTPLIVVLQADEDGSNTIDTPRRVGRFPGNGGNAGSAGSSSTIVRGGQSAVVISFRGYE